MSDERDVTKKNEGQRVISVTMVTRDIKARSIEIKFAQLYSYESTFL